MSAKGRKGSRDKRKNNGGALAGTLFTAAMICCCVLIYLLSKGGRNTAKDTSMDIPPQPTAQMERVYPSVEVFFKRAKGYGFDAEYTEDDGYAPDKGYTLKRGELDGGALVLSMRNMGVCGFTLMIPAAAKPDDICPMIPRRWSFRCMSSGLAGMRRKAHGWIQTSAAL